ncbi:MAG: GDCCVxC domain-containing (seleno)protein [Burkholderiaceae bacterium]
MILQSVLTCPRCGYAKLETMPLDACQFFYDCVACHQVLRPRPGDCCVFCSYGDIACPSVQLARPGVAVMPGGPSSVP